MPSRRGDQAPGRTRRGRGWTFGAAIIVLCLLVALPGRTPMSSVARPGPAVGAAHPSAGVLPPSTSVGPLSSPHSARPDGSGPPPTPGNWSLVPTSPTPPPDQSGSMIYDPVAGEFVLFSGASNGNAQGSTWVFSHGTWTDLTSTLATAPSPRWYDTFVWDASDGYGLLFGGRNSNVDLNDTWAFNGTAWTQIVTTVAPPPETTGRAAYDAADGYVWMYGGFSIMPGLPGSYNATWTYHAGAWDNISANVTGAPPDAHAATFAVYDSTDGYVMMYGGSEVGGSSCTQTGNTWTYVHGAYSNITATVGPSPPVSLGSRMMADDPQVGGVVLYGGWDGGSCGLSSQTWAFAGGEWYPENISWNPGPLWDGEMAGDGPNGSALLFSGNTMAGSSSQSTETWNFTPGLRASISGSFSGEASVTVRPSAVVGGVPPFIYRWTWGDGSSPNVTAAPSHVYTTAGTFQIELQVTGSYGRTAAAFANATVVAALGQTAQATPSAGIAPLAVSFQSQGTAGVSPYSYSWTFQSAGATATGPSASFTYTTPGRYAPTVTVTDADGHQVVSQLAVVVVQALGASVTAAPTLALSGTPVDFAAVTQAGLGPFNYAWNFGDGSQLTGSANESHTYSGSGSYHVTVSVTDDLSESVTAAVTVQVALPIVISVVADPSSVVLGQVLTLTADSLGGTPPVTISWTGLPPGCPASASSLLVTCVPSATGTYHVDVWANDSAGQSRHANTTVQILPAASAPGAATGWLLWAAVGAVAAVVVVAAAVMLWRSRRPPGRAPTTE